MRKQRNDTLSVLKLFAAYMVVFIHVPFYGRIGVAVDALARFAVPFFFLVSGFYSYKITPDKIKHRLFHLLSLLALAAVAYTTYNLLILLVKTGPQATLPYFQPYLDPTKLVKLLAFNVPVYSSHLWYLLAIVYVYCILLLTTKCRFPEKMLFGFSLLALLLNLLLGEGLSLFRLSVPRYVIRNFALFGIPFFGLGMLARKHRDRLSSFSPFVIVGAAVVGVLATMLSCYFVKPNELYLGSLFILFSLVAIFIRYSTANYPAWLLKLTSYSPYIYIFHRMVSAVLENGYAFLGLNYTSSITLQMLHPPVVCVVTTAIAYILLKVTQKQKENVPSK